MGYWTEQCEQAKPISQELGSIMPLALTIEQVDELAEELPPVIESLLLERHFLAWDIIVGDESGLEFPQTPAEKMLEGVIDHKAVHIVHRDNKARFVCARGPRPDTVVLHPDSFSQAHRAGLVELTRYPFLRCAISHACAQFLVKDEELDADYSIFLATAIGDQLVHLNITPFEERRIFEAHQSAVMSVAVPQLSSHLHQAHRSAIVKQSILLGKRVPHFKKIAPDTNLGVPDTSLWVKNLATRH